MNNDPLRMFEPGFSDVDNARCQCGDSFAQHQKPPAGVPWDICSFPCTKCDCQEFYAAPAPAQPEGEQEKCAACIANNARMAVDVEHTCELRRKAAASVKDEREGKSHG